MIDQDIQYTRVENLKMAWARIGEASSSPLVFLHGLGDSAIITFRPIAQHPMLHRTPALLTDLPGFGYSTAPDDWPSTTEDQAEAVSTLLDTLGVTTAPVMGHSMGGSIAILLASRRPDLVSRLVVAEPLIRLEQSELGRTIARRQEADFVARGFGMLQRATQRQASRGEKAAQGFQEPLSRANPLLTHRSATSLLQERSPSFLELLQQIRVPRILLAGEHSPGNTSELLAAGISVVRIPGAGHSMMSDNPDAFAKAISEALTS